MILPLWHHFAVSGVETWLWLPPLAALLISFFTSMVGISGAFLLVPFQMSVLGFASPSASATNLVFNLLAIPGGLYRYGCEQRLFWPLALVITAGGIPGVFLGAWLRTHALADRDAFEPFAAAVLGYLAWRMLRDVRAGPGRPPAAGPVSLTAVGWREIRFRHGAAEHAFGVPLMLAFAFGVGAVGTAYGIGGGAFMVPLCLSVWQLPVHAIAGATLLATFLTSAIALIAYSVLPAPHDVAVRPDWALGLSFGLGGLVGAYLGARLQRRVHQAWLKGLLALLLASLAVRYAWPG
ncbi:MAG: sulfite exporter TauE/SafE family protein [Thiobacillaceae bacterium]